MGNRAEGPSSAGLLRGRLPVVHRRELVATRWIWPRRGNCRRHCRLGSRKPAGQDCPSFVIETSEHHSAHPKRECRCSGRILHTRPESSMKTREQVPHRVPMRIQDAYAYFLARYPTYSKTGRLDALRSTEYRRLDRSEEHTSELQSPDHLVCRLLLEKKKIL